MASKGITGTEGKWTSIAVTELPEGGLIIHGYRPDPGRAWWKPWTWSAGHWEEIGQFRRADPEPTDRERGETDG